MADFSLSKIITLLDKANEQHVNISFAEDVLSVQVQKGKQIDKSLLEELRDNKPFLIHYFKNFGNAANGSGIPAIPKADRDEYTNIPASFAQERLWFIHQLEGSVQYHLPTIIRLKGNLNVAAIRYTLQNIINRHETLRTVIIEQEGKVCQKVLPKDQWQLNTVEGSLYKNSPEELQHFIQQLVSQPFDLSADTMLRAHLIRMEADEHILVVTMHHLASDAWSEPILLNEVLELYSAFTQGRNPQLTDVEIQYADYAIWQRNYLQGEVLDKKLNYWKDKLEGLETLQLPVDIARPVSVTSNGGQLSFFINKQTADQLAGLCREQGVTLFMLLLSVYKIVLHRYSGQQDITVGTSIASRQQRELEGLIGYFVNILALRDEIQPDNSFIELLQQVKATTLGAYQHQDVPFEKVVEAVVSERNTGRNPLFQVMLVLANTPKASGISISGLELSFEATEHTTAKFDITFFINETPDGLEGRVQYSTDLFSAAFIRRMTVHFSNLLKAAVSNPQQKAGSLSMLEKEEETRLLNDFNNASVAYPADKSIVDLFEERAEKTPEQTALVFEDESLTYQELNERSNQLAHFLKSKGAAPGMFIPLYVERSAAMMIGMLGILKAGAAYVPVDTDFPQERINYMLQNTDATIVVSNSSVSAALEDADVVIVETDDTIVSYQPKTNLAVKPSPKDILYVIYTSGSTGRPKGVMVTHQNIVDYYFGLDKYTSIANCKSFALVSTIGTDLGNTVIFASLLSGGALHVFSKTSVSNAAYLQRYFQEQQIDCVKIVPSHWKALSTDDELLLPKKLIIFGGEALPAEAVRSIQSSGSHCAIVNHYGPTETTIGKLLHPVGMEMEYGSTIPIGKPFSNTRVYVLTKELQLCPQGIPGQLFIAGHGVAKGYYNNESLTAEKFIDNPFILSNTEKEQWGEMYATGDKVKWLPDGNILFMGRADDQVKIRGYRVEPGEVESILQQCNLVKAAAVVAVEDKLNDKKLVAYIVPKDEFDREEILAYLKEKLPEYMVPAVLVPMDALPLTANGKINRKALPHPDETETATGQYVAPRNEAETTMAALWADILEIEEGEAGIHTDFFELGGHSLLAVRLISGIRKAFGVELPIGDVFDYPTIAGLTGRLGHQSGQAVLPSIGVQNKPAYIPLSFSQERLWFIDQLDGSTQYHIPAILKLHGTPDKQALSRALQQIVKRHEVLRTLIREKDGQPYQSVQDADDWALQQVDGAMFTKDKVGLEQYLKQYLGQPFNLSADYMLRAALIQLRHNEYVLVAALHHIASDAWSASVMVKELMEFYHAGLEERKPSQSPLPIQYADFAIWQRNYLQGEVLDKKLDYWKEKLQGLASLQLPTDNQRPSVQGTNGAVRISKIDKKLADRIHVLSQQQGATLFMTLLASLNVLLYRYSGQEDICVGTPVAGRQQAELETLIGFFVNTLALRCAVDGNTSFKDLLQQVKATTLGAYEHQDVPFEKVVETIAEQRDLSRSPLFQVMLILQNTPKANKLQLKDVEIYPGTEEVHPHATSKFDLTFTITETTEGLTLVAEYATDLYRASTIDKMIAHYLMLLQSVVERPEQKVSLLPMLSVEEEQQLLHDFNNTSLPYPNDRTIIDLFEEQVDISPSATAIIHGQETITYQQLHGRSNRLAHYLVSKGVTAETLVPVCIERSINMLVAILGILKAGAAYVPIDPEYPAERISYMLEDTAAGFLLTSSTAVEQLPKQEGLQIIQVDRDEDAINSQPLHNTGIRIRGSQLAYIIYTSGSTGRPKGVMITHSNVFSFIHWSRREFANSRFDIAYFGTSICFDLSIFEIFYPLSIGKPIRLLQNGLQMAQYISEDNFVMANTVPSVIRSLLTDGVNFNHFSIINMAGEPIPAQVHQNLDTDKIEVRNLYGPTESTTYSTFTKLNNKLPVTIGKPVGNTVIYILNPAKQLVPVGVAGEIHISGAGLARGYFNQPELTAERFIDNPFSTEAAVKMYRTGDLGHWLPDGNIEFLGRADTQVKVRGFRIELAEIETILQQSSQVLQAVVEAGKDAQGNGRLVAYIVPNSTFQQPELVNFLQQKLPAYMVPSLWVEMAVMPLTPNGKVNRKALPQPDVSELSAKNYVAPANETERALVEVWQELLGAEQIGVQDNFFELGGHSLLAMRLVSAIREKLQVELTVKNLFYYPTIATLAAQLEKQHKGLLRPSIEPALSRPEQIPLSFSQERLWFINQLEGSTQYHIPIILQLQGALNKEALFHALQHIVQRHEVLRTVIREKDGIGYQYIKNATGWLPGQVNGSAYAEDTAGLHQYIQQLISKPFALSEDEMLRVMLVELSEQHHILVAAMHHIASDGQSVSIFINELSALYTSYVQGQPARLAPLPIQYSDYAIWQRNYLQGEVLDKKLEYWKEKLKGITALELPFGKPRPLVQGSNGALLHFSIEKELANQLQLLSRQQGATLFMTLLAAFKVLLYRYSGRQDICVGTPIAGRQQPEVENLIGFFVNTLALRTEIQGEDSFTGLLAKVKQTTVEAYEHQEVPFEKVVDAVVKERDISHSPLFQVMLGLQNSVSAQNPQLGELQISGVSAATVHATSKFDLSFNLTEAAEGLNLSVEYATGLFNTQIIGRMVAHFKELLSSIVHEPGRNIDSLSVLAPAEKDQLLTGFNNIAENYQADKTVVDLLEEQVAKTPDAIAVIFEDAQLTYRQLNERSNQLAHYLRMQGIAQETLIPICLERSLEMIIGILAILKAGAAYVPIDPAYPQERISYMLNDTSAGIILTTTSSKAAIPVDETYTIITIDNWDEIGNEPVENMAVKPLPHQLAYCIYTSGSTGQPKGALNEHKGIMNRLSWGQDYFKLTAQDAVLQKTTFAFDVSVWELLWPLLTGAKLVFAKPGGHRDTGYLQSVINSQHITVIHFVPSMLEAFLSDIHPGDCPGLKKVFCSGEALKASHVQLFHEKLTAVELHNLYGPTETAIEVTWCNLSKKEENITVVPIGRPVANTPIYLLDKLQNPVPVGVPGDLYIAGIQVGRGYLNRPELTAEKFVTDPFSKVSGASMYKTGDIGRWLEGGNIEYLGRTDDQIKIRGYRIELGEIESLARRSGLVKQVVVFAPTDRNGTKRLTGYVVTDEQFTKEALMEYLSLQLPEYMVPQLWIEIDSIPLTPNGKVDKNALPQIDDTVASTIEYTAPRNELEQQLAEVWQQLLGINQVGIQDNFFALGGDSILTIQVMSRMRRQGFDLQPKDLFLHQTIEKLAAAIASRSTAKNTMAEQGVLTGTSGLLPIQQWFLHKNVVQVSHFNQAVLLGIDKTVTVTTLQSVIEQLILRHDALRFIYTQTAEGWQQHYGGSSTTVLTEDLRDSTETDILAAQIQQRANYYQRQLNVESGQLLRAILIQTPGTESHNRLLLIIHHLATDGISWRILLEDMEQLLDAASQDREMNLGSKTSSYRQWHNALQQYGQSNRLLSQKGFWQETIRQYEPLPVDTNYEAPVAAADIHHYSLTLNTDVTKQLLQEAAQAYHTEINDLLLAALTMTLTEWSGNNKVVIGLEGHGREAITENIDLSRTVGWFTTLYPVLLQVENEGEAGIIKSIKEQLRKVPDRGIGYGVLQYINGEKALQTQQNWDIIFNYLGQLDNVVKQSRWLAGATESAGNGMGELNEVSEKLSINSSVRGGQLVVNWSYSNKHYHAKTIEALAASYLDDLQALITHCLNQQSEGPQKTPSDYGLGQEITYTELDEFLEEMHNGIPRRAQLQSLYRLSGLQQGMLFHSLYDEKSGGAYTEQLTCDLLNVNLEHLQKSWQQVMNTHSILRSGFYYDVFSIPVQAVYKNVTLPVEELDFSSMSIEQQALAVEQYENEEKSKGFDFATVPLMRIGLLRLSDERYHMVWTFHHILSDGWSLPVVMEEFLSTYELLATDNTVTRQEEDKFEDYIRFIERGDKEAEENYWRQYLQGVEQATLLPFISNSKERNKGAGTYSLHPLHFTEAQTAQVKAFAQQQHLTVNTLVQGVWSLLLHHYTGSKNIVYGVTVSGRPDELPGIEKKVGMYINTLPLHSTMDDGEKVTEWLTTLQNHQVASRQYQHTPLPEIQNWMGVPGDLFDSILVFENFPLSELTTSKKWLLQIENAHVQEQTNYPLTIIVSSTGSLTVRFSYNTSLLETVYVENIATHFEHVLLQLIAANDLCLPDVKIITPSEEKQVLQDFNNTSTEYPADKTIIDLFEEQVARTPDAIAVVFEEVHLTYAQLNNRSNQLARHLLGQGIQLGTLVPICIERSAEMIIGILGILKAGCAYVPINVDYPPERISFMLEDTAATVVVCSRKSEVALPSSPTISKVYIDDSHIFSQPEHTANPAVVISPQDLAYVMYTSASTGKAKGVLIEHGSVVSLVKGVQYTTFSGSDTLLATGSSAFDASTFEYWGMLLNGGRLVLCREEVLLNTLLLKQEIASNRVNKIWFTASWLNQLVDTDISVFEGLKTILAGGEKLSEKHISALKKAYPAIVIINGYGPTENTTFSLTHTVTEADVESTIPIGQPLSNRTAFIVDNRGQLMPVGVPGEIWLGGAGVARGYLNRSDLMVEKFVPNPFSKAPDARIYKTGDIGRWLPNGNIEFLGRIDDQVKIRGYRIELGEIESTLQQYTGVLQAVVVAPKDRNGNKSLAAYVVTEDNFNREAITTYLKERLPAYMIPQAWVQMESFPLTPNGKIDKKALPAPGTGGETGREYVAPTTETETQLAEIWQELLGVKQPGIHDNFFEMGGHSLLVVRMVPMLKKRFGLLVPIPVIFKFPTIYELGNYLEWQQEPEEEDSNTTFEIIKI